MGRFRVSKDARADLINIWVYIARDSVENAERLNLLFHDKFKALAAHPGAGRSREELGPGIRSFPVGNYVI